MALSADKGPRPPQLRVLNAEPETVALAALEGLERCVRNRLECKRVAPEDVEFMDASLDFFASRLRTLKMQAAAGWHESFRLMLDRCHSILVDPADLEEKEGVRTKKMKCMACGRWEHRCNFVLCGVGPFEAEQWNKKSFKELRKPWLHFLQSYSAVHGEEYVDRTRDGRLPSQDMGAYAIGKTCLRKAQLYYIANTFIMESCYSAHQASSNCANSCVGGGKEAWLYADSRNAGELIARLEQLQLAIADDKRLPPQLFVDEQFWGNVERARSKAGGGDDDWQFRLLRERADLVLRNQTASRRESEQEESDADADINVISSDDEDCRPKRRRICGSAAASRRRRCLEEDEESVAECIDLTASAGETRKSRRVAQLSPEEEDGLPRNVGRPAASEHDIADEDEEDEEDEDEEEEEDEDGGAVVDVRTALKLAPPAVLPDAVEMAAEARMPGGRLPSQRSAQINLAALMIKLMREGRTDDSAVCNQALFTMHELIADCARKAQSADR